MFDDLMRNQGLNERFAKAQRNQDAVDPREAAEYVSEFMRQAPPEVQQKILHDYVRQLDPQQRRALGEAMIQHRDTPVDRVRNDDDDDLAGALRRSVQALGGRQSSSPSDGLGELFGMFGGMLGGQGQAGRTDAPSRNEQYREGALDERQRRSAQADPMGGLGQLLQHPAARAGLVSLAGMIGSKLLNQRR